MAKKIVSLLCALAMLVTMVSLVATFTASATGTSSVYFPQFFRAGNYDIEASACTYKGYAAGTENRKDQTMIHGDASLGNFAALRTYGLSYKATDKNVFNLSAGFTLDYVVLFGQEANTKSAVVSVGGLKVSIASPGSNNSNTVTKLFYGTTELDTKTNNMTGAANTQYISAFQGYGNSDYLSMVSGTLYARRVEIIYNGAGNVTVNVYKRNDAASVPRPINTLDFTLSGTIDTPDFANVRIAMEVGIGAAATGTSVACGAFQGTFTPAAVDAYDTGATYVTTNMGNFANDTYGFARTNTSVANSAVHGTRTYFNVAQRVAAYDASANGLGTALYVVGNSSSSLDTSSARVVDNTVYNLSGGFEASWSYFATHPACNIKHTVSFGQLAVVSEKTSSLGTGQANVWVEYAGTPITAVQTLTFPNPNSATTTAANNMLAAMHTAGLTDNSENNYTMSNNRWGNFAISYDGATNVVTLNVTDSAGAALGTTFSATLTSPKLNAGVVSMEIVDAYSHYRRSGLLNFRGTYERKLSSASIDVDGNGGTPSLTALDLTSDGHIDASALPTATIDDVHKKFGGWYTAADDSGEPVDLATSTFNPGEAIYAHWDNVPYVNVNGNGGKANVTYVDLDDAGHLTSMPTATRRHNTFAGWFDDAENGNEITTASVLADGDTIYAHWALSPNEMVDFSAANTTTGYFVDTENYPVSIFSKNGTAAFHTLGTLGSYSMDNFTIDMNYYYNHQRANTDGAVGPYMILTVGDLVLTFEMTRGSTENNGWASVLYDLSGTYKNQALTFSNTQISSGLRTYESTMSNSYNEIHAVNSNFSSWGNYQSISYGFHFRFSYDRATGVLTIQNIKNNAANWTSTATVGTDGFENAAVSVELISPSVPTADGTGLDSNQHKVTLANVYGVYTPFTPAATYLTPAGAGLTLDSSADKNTAINVVYYKDEVDAE
ncbi:MAG: InlB B-repeat-containing protein, partial [Clostridia bacterium]|nr:InlB B-repeat-containing protein [Clostridia bacterium]